MSSHLLFQTDESDWNEDGRRTLRDFVHLVASTHLKVKILNLFVADPYLCLSSEYVALRLGADIASVQRSARELSDANTFSYCASFAQSDLCCLSFASYLPAIQHCLRLWRLSLSMAPGFVCEQLDTADYSVQTLREAA